MAEENAAARANPPKAFISYSHDTTDHRAWVERLATDLRSSTAIDVTLDRWHLRPGEDLATFMERGVRDAERVVVVCSSDYVQKAEQRVGGAGYESLLVTAELVATQG